MLCLCVGTVLPPSQGLGLPFPQVLPCHGPLLCPPSRLAVDLSCRTCSDLVLPASFWGWYFRKTGPGREKAHTESKQIHVCSVSAGWAWSSEPDTGGHGCRLERESIGGSQRAQATGTSSVRAGRVGPGTQGAETGPRGPHAHVCPGSWERGHRYWNLPFPCSKRHPFPSSDKCFTNSLF